MLHLQEELVTYGSFRHKSNFSQFFLRTDDSIIYQKG